MSGVVVLGDVSMFVMLDVECGRVVRVVVIGVVWVDCFLQLSIFLMLSA